MIEPPEEPKNVSPPAVVIAWDPSVVSPDEYAELVGILGDIVRAEGGAGLTLLSEQERTEKMTNDQQDSTNTKLVIEVVIPDGISDDDLQKYIAELALSADLFHRELGGHGLRLHNLTVERNPKS